MACDCATRPVLYWLKNAVWEEAEKKAGRKLGHSCVRYVEQAMGRSLTLHDLDVAGYRKTIERNSEAFMQKYTRGTILGACRVAGITVPDGWAEPTEQPHLDGIEVGEYLAQQTPNAAALLPTLIEEVNQCFPG
jgi:hypothetical protein